MSSSSIESLTPSVAGEFASGVAESWASLPMDDDREGWDAVSADVTGPGGGVPHNLVAHGVIGDEYRMMKEAARGNINAAAKGASSTPHRDPYHGRTTEPKTVREPPRESFNVMVVGEAGLGKTTLLESFFKSFRDDEAAFALFERKETATELETRRQLAEAQVAFNAAERELQGAIEKGEYAVCDVKQREKASLAASMASLEARLKKLSAVDERSRNELRALREATKGTRLEMKKYADGSDFTSAAERQLEATILQAEVDSLASHLKQMRRDPRDRDGKRSAKSDEDFLDEDLDGKSARGGGRGLSSATVTVKAFDPFAITVGKHELEVTLVDTPGYGESLHAEDSFETIMKHVDGLFQQQLRSESTWNARDAESLRLQDPLIHVCLYFIAPHRLKHIDVAFMRALHKRVNIVPIIAKSDTMTTKEKEEFKTVVREALTAEGIEAYPFDMSTIRHMEQQDKQEYKAPWAVIGSTDAYLDAGATVYLRKYPWGNALSSEPAHSDLPALRNLLMWSGQWHDLKMASRAKYETWRAARPLSRRSSAAVAQASSAAAARVRAVTTRIGDTYRAVTATAASACEAVGVPPRLAYRALIVLLLALSAMAVPPVVRYATGVDDGASRKLALTRAQVSALVHEKGVLVKEYERKLADLRSRLSDERASVEVAHERTNKAKDERGDLKGQLRVAHHRAEVAEAALAAATDRCTVWKPIESAVKRKVATVSSWAKGATEGTAEAFSHAVRETPSIVQAAGGWSANVTHSVGSTIGAHVGSTARWLLGKSGASSAHAADAASQA